MAGHVDPRVDIKDGAGHGRNGVEAQQYRQEDAGSGEELAVDGCIGLEDRRDRTDLSQRIGFNCEGVLVAEMQLGTHQTGLQGRRGRSGRIGVRRHVLL